MRAFLKNAANYMSLGVGGIANRLHGACKVSVHAMAQRTEPASSITINDNVILAVNISGSSAGIFMGVDGFTEVRRHLRVGGRSAGSDTFQAVTLAPEFDLVRPYSCGAVYDYPADRLYGYFDGQLTAEFAANFGSNSFINGGPTEADAIGNRRGSGSIITSDQFGGNIAEVAIWIDDIGPVNFARLAEGESALNIRPDALIHYTPLNGNASTEVDVAVGRICSITGVLPVVEHPLSIRHPLIDLRLIPFAAGSSTYTEPLTALAESYAAVSDVATYIAAGEAIITAGVSAADTVQMLEGVLTTAASASSATDVAQRAEALLATIQAVDSVQTAAALVEQLITTVTGAAEASDTLTSAGTEAGTTTAEAVVTVADVAQYRDQLLAAAGVTATVTDTAVRADTALSAAQAEATVQDIVQMLEQVSSAATAQTSVIDTVTSGIAESLLTSATAITSATDQQLMVDNLTIMVQSGVSLGEIHGYLEQLATAATSGASVIDVLVTAFVGRYIFRDYCSPRSFRDYCSPRSFRDYCSPRGAA